MTSQETPDSSIGTENSMLSHHTGVANIIYSDRRQRDQLKELLLDLQAKTQDEHCGVPEQYRGGLLSGHVVRNLAWLYDEVEKTLGVEESWKVLWGPPTPFLLNACIYSGSLTTSNIQRAWAALRAAHSHPHDRQVPDFTPTRDHSVSIEGGSLVDDTGPERHGAATRSSQVIFSIKRERSPTPSIPTQRSDTSSSLTSFDSSDFVVTKIRKLHNSVSAVGSRVAVASAGTQMEPESRQVSVRNMFDCAPIIPVPAPAPEPESRQVSVRSIFDCAPIMPVPAPPKQQPCVRCSATFAPASTQTEDVQYVGEGVQTSETCLNVVSTNTTVVQAVGGTKTELHTDSNETKTFLVGIDGAEQLLNNMLKEERRMDRAERTARQNEKTVTVSWEKRKRELAYFIPLMNAVTRGDIAKYTDDPGTS